MNVEVKHVSFIEIAVHVRLLAPVVVADLFPNLASLAADGHEPIVTPLRSGMYLIGSQKSWRLRIREKTPVFVLPQQLVTAIRQSSWKNDADWQRAGAAAAITKSLIWRGYRMQACLLNFNSYLLAMSGSRRCSHPGIARWRRPADRPEGATRISTPAALAFVRVSARFATSYPVIPVRRDTEVTIRYEHGQLAKVDSIRTRR